MSNEQLGMLIPHMALMIPILSIVLSLAVVIVAIVTWNRRKVRELEQRHKERMAAIEKGIDVPVELPPHREPHSALLRGLIWLGVGLAVVLGSAHDDDWMSLGWIPVAVGAAYLIYYAVEGRKRARPPANDISKPGEPT